MSVPLLLYVLSTIDGRIVFYFLLFSFQLYVCTLLCLALFIRDEAVPLLVVRFLRLCSIFCWGGICFMFYAMIGSMVYTRFQREVPPASVPRPVTIAVVETSSDVLWHD